VRQRLLRRHQRRRLRRSDLLGREAEARQDPLRRADGRTFALVKAGLAGTFAYNRLKHAAVNAKGDPTLSKLVAPLTGAIDELKDLPARLKNGDSTGDVVKSYRTAVNNVKSAGEQAGAEVTNQVPSLCQPGG
jgi:hypothetical protein